MVDQNDPALVVLNAVEIQDYFRCGLCDTEWQDFDDLIRHKVIDEECSIVLRESKHKKGLLLPRFFSPKARQEEKRVNSSTQRKSKRTPNPEEEPKSKRPKNNDKENAVPSEKYEKIKESDMETWKCKECEQTFQREASVRCHIIVTHMEDCRDNKDDGKDPSWAPDPGYEVDLECNDCNRTFISVQALRSHVFLKHGKRYKWIRRVRCSKCFTSFSSDKRLQRHLRCKRSCVKVQEERSAVITYLAEKPYIVSFEPIETNDVVPTEPEQSWPNESQGNKESFEPLGSGDENRGIDFARELRELVSATVDGTAFDEVVDVDMELSDLMKSVDRHLDSYGEEECTFPEMAFSHEQISGDKGDPQDPMEASNCKENQKHGQIGEGRSKEVREESLSEPTRTEKNSTDAECSSEDQTKKDVHVSQVKEKENVEDYSASQSHAEFFRDLESDSSVVQTSSHQQCFSMDVSIPTSRFSQVLSTNVLVESGRSRESLTVSASKSPQDINSSTNSQKSPLTTCTSHPHFDSSDSLLSSNCPRKPISDKTLLATSNCPEELLSQEGVLLEKSFDKHTTLSSLESVFSERNAAQELELSQKTAATSHLFSRELFFEDSTPSCHQVTLSVDPLIVTSNYSQELFPQERVIPLSCLQENTSDKICSAPVGNVEASLNEATLPTFNTLRDENLILSSLPSSEQVSKTSIEPSSTDNKESILKENESALSILIKKSISAETGVREETPMGRIQKLTEKETTVATASKSLDDGETFSGAPRQVQVMSHLKSLIGEQSNEQEGSKLLALTGKTICGESNPEMKSTKGKNDPRELSEQRSKKSQAYAFTKESSTDQQLSQTKDSEIKPIQELSKTQLGLLNEEKLPNIRLVTDNFSKIQVSNSAQYCFEIKVGEKPEVSANQSDFTQAITKNQDLTEKNIPVIHTVTENSHSATDVLEDSLNTQVGSHTEERYRVQQPSKIETRRSSGSSNVQETSEIQTITEASHTLTNENSDIGQGLSKPHIPTDDLQSLQEFSNDETCLADLNNAQGVLKRHTNVEELHNVQKFSEVKELIENSNDNQKFSELGTCIEDTDSVQDVSKMRTKVGKSHIAQEATKMENLLEDTNNTQESSKVVTQMKVPDNLQEVSNLHMFTDESQNAREFSEIEIWTEESSGVEEPAQLDALQKSDCPRDYHQVQVFIDVKNVSESEPVSSQVSQMYSVENGSEPPQFPILAKPTSSQVQPSERCLVHQEDTPLQDEFSREAACFYAKVDSAHEDKNPTSEDIVINVGAAAPTESAVVSNILFYEPGHSMVYLTDVKESNSQDRPGSEQKSLQLEFSDNRRDALLSLTNAETVIASGTLSLCSSCGLPYEEEHICGNTKDCRVSLSEEQAEVIPNQSTVLQDPLTESDAIVDLLQREDSNNHAQLLSNVNLVFEQATNEKPQQEDQPTYSGNLILLHCPTEKQDEPLKQFCENVNDQPAEPSSSIQVVALKIGDLNEYTMAVATQQKQDMDLIKLLTTNTETTTQTEKKKTTVKNKLPFALFKCDVCSYRSNTSDELCSHLQSHIGNQMLLQCSECSILMVKREDLVRHFERVHNMRNLESLNIPDVIEGESSSMDPQSIKIQQRKLIALTQFLYYQCSDAKGNKCLCPMCGKDIGKKDFKDHMKGHLNIKLYACQSCSKTFVSNKILVRHEQAHKNLYSFQCSVCLKAFNTKAALYSHTLTHQEPKFGCLICGKAFRQKATLSVHQQTHTSDRPWECQVCDKRFLTKGDLTRHGKKHQKKKTGLILEA